MAKFKIESDFIDVEEIEAHEFHLEDGYIIFTKQVGMSSQNVFLVSADKVESVRRLND